MVLNQIQYKAHGVLGKALGKQCGSCGELQEIYIHDYMCSVTV